MTTTASALVAAARELCGTPWIHQGRTSKGVDCIGLVSLAARNAGLDIFKFCGIKEPRNYQREPDPKLFELVNQCCERISQPVPGSLLFFKFKRDLYPRHFGIFTEAGTVIHAESKARRCVIEHGYRAHWLTWTHSVWKLPGVRYE